MKSLLSCRSVIEVVIITMVVTLMASQITDAYAKKNKKKGKIHSTLDEIYTELDQHDTDVKAAVTQHDSDVYDDLETINRNLLDHDTEVNNLLSDVNDSLTNVIEPKLDAILEACGNGGATASVPKTGQTLCYDASGVEIVCTGTGLDGEKQAGVDWPNPRFTVNGDDIVTDNLTGLIWLQDANLAGITKTWDEAIYWAENLVFAGFEDWRLPNIKELSSLLHYGFARPPLPDTLGTGQWGPGDPFNNVQSSVYWSSTTNAINTATAWKVNFITGYIDGSALKLNDNYVWCVRGP